jgi:hypothetical protein
VRPPPVSTGGVIDKVLVLLLFDLAIFFPSVFKFKVQEKDKNEHEKCDISFFSGRQA